MGTVRHGHDHHGVRGAKSVATMRAIIRDYTRPGDLIVDPYAGGGTTLLAAVIEGRRAIGAEMDPETFKKARRRLEAGFTPQLFAS
jgi:site-specific DNA-methyltransferase (adenine-specific)